jgi:ribosomal protein S18 acetylase RimI-like enzyme
MKQLIMRWVNDGAEAEFTLPEGTELLTLKQIDDGVRVWADIVRHMEKDGVTEFPEGYTRFYESVMQSEENYREELCFFLSVRGTPAATFTVICNKESGEGYLHMVASKPEFRGLGLGNLMSRIAVSVLKKEGMRTAYLTTDDWRIPAIKTYLKAGFSPDLTSEEDFHSRWEKIYAIINADK